jgi:hypothetical protein
MGFIEIMHRHKRANWYEQHDSRKNHYPPL